LVTKRGLTSLEHATAKKAEKRGISGTKCGGRGEVNGTPEEVCPKKKTVTKQAKKKKKK